jgi:hemerythrin-like domain-containing protein
VATLTPAFRAESERIHNEHQFIGHVLSKLDSALDHLVCYSEVYANLASAEDVRLYGRQLAEQFPGHCRREEAVLLNPVSQVSPELREFCNQMRLEHQDLIVRLATFRDALDAFDKADGLYEAVCQLKEVGKDLITDVRRHVETEEHELSGFL